jgi:hypothetical protein
LITVVSWLVMSLWNALLPTLFGWRTIGFVQAGGLLILSRILFGGMRGPGFGPPWRHHMHARWAQMSPEQRETFREGLRHRCRGTTPPEANTDS